MSPAEWSVTVYRKVTSSGRIRIYRIKFPKGKWESCPPAYSE